VINLACFFEQFQLKVEYPLVFSFRDDFPKLVVHNLEASQDCSVVETDCNVSAADLVVYLVEVLVRFEARIEEAGILLRHHLMYLLKEVNRVALHIDNHAEVQDLKEACAFDHFDPGEWDAVQVRHSLFPEKSLETRHRRFGDLAAVHIDSLDSFVDRDFAEHQVEDGLAKLVEVSSPRDSDALFH
jgi:hypothetical protein